MSIMERTRIGVGEMDGHGVAEKRVAVVIDDDPDIRALLEDILVLSGFSVVPTERAKDGIEAVRTFNPDLTLIDISMPGMDGFTAARQIREISNTHLVIVSGRTEEIDVVQGFAAGADDYVFKPFRVRELRARLEARVQRAVVSSGSGAGSAASGSTASAPAQSGTAAAGRVVPGPAVPATAPPAPAPATAGTPPWHPASAAGSALTQTDEPTTPTDAPATATATATDMPTFERAALAVVVPTELTHGALTLNRETREVHLEGLPIQLTDREFILLATLMEHGHRVRSTSSLVLAMRGESYVTASFVTAADRGEVAEQIRSLRRKLGDSELSPKWIETVRDVGYRSAAQ